MTKSDLVKIIDEVVDKKIKETIEPMVKAALSEFFSSLSNSVKSMEVDVDYDEVINEKLNSQKPLVRQQAQQNGRTPLRTTPMAHVQQQQQRHMRKFTNNPVLDSIINQTRIDSTFESVEFNESDANGADYDNSYSNLPNPLADMRGEFQSVLKRADAISKQKQGRIR